MLEYIRRFQIVAELEFYGPINSMTHDIGGEGGIRTNCLNWPISRASSPLPTRSLHISLHTSESHNQAGVVGSIRAVLPEFYSQSNSTLPDLPPTPCKS